MKENLKKETTSETIPTQQTNREKIEKLRKEGSRIVKGRFKSFETPGETIKFPFSKYGDPVKTYTMTDNHIYDIPLMVAKHLNSNCWYPIHHYKHDDEGKITARVGERVYRYGFTPLDFTDVGEPGPQIITVEKL